ncbi:MAG TPA: redoxin domain-containing protein, partial [Aggregatilineales bacterium]|nr:redoxin domain-containing protein [Aggregatilineales bacterium]
IKSGLRPGEVIEGEVDLESVAARLRDENGALRKSTGFVISELDGIPMLDASWLIPGTEETMFTRTRLLDGGDTVYLTQAQYPAGAASEISPMVDTIFSSMHYTAPDELMNPNEIGLEVGMQAPDFSAPLLGSGEEVALSDYRGEVVFLNMWATWCGPCHREAPALQSYYESYGGDFEILAMNVGETSDQARGFVNQYGLTFPVLMDEFNQVAGVYELTAYPTTYVIGRDGVILEKIRGSFSEDGLRDVLAVYLGRR